MCVCALLMCVARAQRDGSSERFATLISADEGFYKHTYTHAALHTGIGNAQPFPLSLLVPSTEATLDACTHAVSDAKHAHSILAEEERSYDAMCHALLTIVCKCYDAVGRLTLSEASDQIEGKCTPNTQTITIQTSSLCCVV